MHWRIKGVIQYVLSTVPGGTAVNDCLQLTVGGVRDFEGNVDRKVTDDLLVLLSHLRELQVRPQEMVFLEVGTGWYPTSPLCLSLAGAKTIKTFDIDRHMKHGLTFRLLQRLERHLPAIAKAALLPVSEVEAAYDSLRQARTLPELLERGRIEYFAPADASRTGLPAQSVDIVFSNSVLEHVPPEAILRIMQEGRRVLRPDGFAIHSVNCGDHYAYIDSNITPMNYFSFSERAWRFWNNKLGYQNRLRPQDLKELLQQGGLEIVREKFKPRPELLAALPKIKISPEFQRYTPEQLCTTSVDLVARRFA